MINHVLYMEEKTTKLRSSSVSTNRFFYDVLLEEVLTYRMAQKSRSKKKVTISVTARANGQIFYH
jgi:hypothetical protein